MDNEYRPLSGVEVKDNVMLFNLDFDTLRQAQGAFQPAEKQ